MKTKRLLPPPFAAFLALLSLSAFGHAQSILGTAGNFALLGGTSITSTATPGTVIRNGNVGLSPNSEAAITGFAPTGAAVIINGSIIPTGAVTAEARQDLTKAQVGLAAMPAGTNLGTADLGGKTLTPGVYKFDAAATLSGTVFLDAQRRNGVAWVFQIGTTLTTSAGASVTIINPGSHGGSDYGIFWNCGSAINIAANNQIAGIYLAGTSIVFGVNSTRGGRALALAAISLDNNQIDARGGPGGGDWSGGLEFNQFGAVVTKPDPTTNREFAFRVFGKRHRTTHTSTRIIKGTANASVIQYRVNGGKKWRSTPVKPNGRWTVKATHLRPGQNQLRLRAHNTGGATGSIHRITIYRH